MPDDKKTIDVPQAPANLPDKVKTKWEAAYRDAFTEAQRDEPEHSALWAGRALRAANKVLHFAEPATYDQAMALEDWQFIHRDVAQDGKSLNVVTIHGQKYSFPVQASKQKREGGA